MHTAVSELDFHLKGFVAAGTRQLVRQLSQFCWRFMRFHNMISNMLPAVILLHIDCWNKAACCSEHALCII